ncbi:TIGR02234 family membrane protein [Antrihabitans stalactiti]|uniref:TIGR02234 family membrane protein n=1 Tax=Antrihabitans stalactiti TaxID=2584121 RepID=A0A848KFJ0_9NOCA|nr:TIGR02234 family membrane protein [Antrihabitans stalactiti]NMN94970.1 TIGR02234 family membrane protein [Antrihabitans stalactiti]
MTSTVRRYPIVAALALAVAAACLWGAGKLTWVTVHSSDGLGADRTDDIAGSVWAAALTPLALVLVAGIAAVFAVRGLALRGLGVVLAAVGVAAAIPAISLLAGGATNDRAGRIAELKDRAVVTSVQTAPLAAALALVGAAAAVAAGALIVARRSDRGGLSSKYANPAVRREAAIAGDGEVSQRSLWDALDAGADPTIEGESDVGTQR